jgi:hypothetical protein
VHQLVNNNKLSFYYECCSSDRAISYCMVLVHTVVSAVQKEVQHKFVVRIGARFRSIIIIGYEILAYDSVGLLFVLQVAVRYCRIYKFIRLFTCS